MTFIVCVGSDREEKGEGTLCDAYLKCYYDEIFIFFFQPFFSKM